VARVVHAVIRHSDAGWRRRPSVRHVTSPNRRTTCRWSRAYPAVVSRPERRAPLHEWARRLRRQQWCRRRSEAQSVSCAPARRGARHDGRADRRRCLGRAGACRVGECVGTSGNRG